ncbi:hypothetical protein [Planomicrobium okeanokoites]|nr:hypothetical protein [Planomicrobium okeanokoites]
MAFFATAAELAYDPKSWAAGVWTKEKRQRPLSSERHKTDQQSGVLCHGS